MYNAAKSNKRGRRTNGNAQGVYSDLSQTRNAKKLRRSKTGNVPTYFSNDDMEGVTCTDKKFPALMLQAGRHAKDDVFRDDGSLLVLRR